MEPDMLNFDRAKFDDVWQRVEANNRPMPEPFAAGIPVSDGVDEAERLYWLMDSAALCIALCRCVAAKCPGCVARTLCRMADEERRYMRRLRAMYFILTGGAYCPEEPCPQVPAASEGLRSLYAECVNARDRLLAAAEMPGAEFASTYAQCAAMKDRHAEVCAELIECMMR